MTNVVITRETLVADALNLVPGASALFRKHGVDPEVQCQQMSPILRIGDAEMRCELRDTDELIQDLNLMLALHATSAP